MYQPNYQLRTHRQPRRPLIRLPHRQRIRRRPLQPIPHHQPIRRRRYRPIPHHRSPQIPHRPFQRIHPHRWATPSVLSEFHFRVTSILLILSPPGIRQRCRGSTFTFTLIIFQRRMPVCLAADRGSFIRLQMVAPGPARLRCMDPAMLVAQRPCVPWWPIQITRFRWEPATAGPCPLRGRYLARVILF